MRNRSVVSALLFAAALIAAPVAHALKIGTHGTIVFSAPNQGVCALMPGTYTFTRPGCTITAQVSGCHATATGLPCECDDTTVLSAQGPACESVGLGDGWAWQNDFALRPSLETALPPA